QFFIMVAPVPHLDGDYAAFGQVIEGLEVVDQIVNAARDFRDKPREAQRMLSVSVDTFGQEYPEAENFS
ncbi:peptidylprolyl isomerase, partial [Syntrophomonas wolfei]